MATGQKMAVAVAAAILLSLGARAASIDINPVRIDLTGQRAPAELRLTNTGTAEIAVQVDAVKWDQDADAEDSLIPTELLLAVPPIFSLPPGEQQIVRIGYLGEPNPDLEQSFRLLVTELAPPQTDEGNGSKLAMRMRFSIPVFIAPLVVPGNAELVLLDTEKVNDSLTLTIQNAGNAHARLSRIEVREQAGWIALPEGLSIRYLLPGTSTTIAIPPEYGHANAVRISSIDGRDWEYAVQSPF